MMKASVMLAIPLMPKYSMGGEDKSHAPIGTVTLSISSKPPEYFSSMVTTKFTSYVEFAKYKF